MKRFVAILLLALASNLVLFWTYCLFVFLGWLFGSLIMLLIFAFVVRAAYKLANWSWNQTIPKYARTAIALYGIFCLLCMFIADSNFIAGHFWFAGISVAICSVWQGSKYFDSWRKISVLLVCVILLGWSWYGNPRA